MKALLLSILFVFSYTYICAQEINWIKYTTQNSGLPSNYINTILVDENNTKWVGCNGLVKFDGEFWIVYDTTNSELPSNLIYSLTEDFFGNLWIGTGKGLAKFDRANNWEIFTTENSDLPSEVVTSLKADSVGIWVGAMDFVTYVNGGLGYYNGSSWLVYKKENSPLPDNRIFSLNISNSTLWVGTANGLAELHNGIWNVFQQDTSTLDASDNIAAISFDSSDNIWVACQAMPQILAPVIEGGLAKFDGSDWMVYTYHNSPFPENANSVKFVYSDRFNNIWSALWFQDEFVSSQGYGEALARFNTKNGWVFYTYPLVDPNIHCITMDNSNHLWLGTESGLIEMIDSTLTDIYDETDFRIQHNYKLAQNYPNPFNPVTNIEFTVSHPGFVTLKVYDIIGNEIVNLVNDSRNAGIYNIKFDGSDLASGIYFYVLRSGDFVQSKKMLLLK